MAVDALTQTVRHRLGLGRLLPLGDACDGAWLAEKAATAALRAAAAESVPSVRLESLRLAPVSSDDADHADDAAVPAPPSALPHGPLRIEADFAAGPGLPLPSLADRLRHGLLAAADRQLGLRVRSAELHATDLLDEPYDARTHTSPHDAPEGQGHDDPEETAGVADAVLSVPGVTRLAPVLGGLSLSPASGVSETGPGEQGDRRLLVQCAVAPGRRVLDVARAVREAAARAAEAETPGRGATITVLVTAVDPGPETAAVTGTDTDGPARRTRG